MDDRHARAGRRINDKKAEQLRREFAEFGEIRMPADAEEPVLAPGPRAALFEWLMEMRAADDLAEVGLVARSSALLFGPPGCGKTTFAHHLAARLGLPMLEVGAEGIMAKYMGESEGKVARLFGLLEAQEQPMILFLDEIDAIGGSRAKNTGGSADNARSSMEQYAGIMIAATNRPGDLDPALWRRLHLQVSIDLPGEDERFAILRRYGAPYRWADEDIDTLVDLTLGASPALLRGVMEGVKRALVLAERLGRTGETASDVIRRVVSSVAPPPELDPPPLWTMDDRALAADFSDMTWPPAREDAP